MSAEMLLTTVILTKNESKKIAILLNQAEKWSDQVILLDDYSDDIAAMQELTQHSKTEIVQHHLAGDYAAHRNSVFSVVKGEWTLFLDADEVPEEDFWLELHEKIQGALFDAYCIRRRNIFLGRPLRFGEAGEKRLLRLAKTRLGRNNWQRAVHERWEVSTSCVGVFSSLILHSQPVSISAFVEKLNRYSSLEIKVRKSLSMQRLIFELLCFPIGKFFWNYLAQQGFRDGFPGFALAFLMSYYSLIVRVQQYEKSL